MKNALSSLVLQNNSFLEFLYQTNDNIMFCIGIQKWVIRLRNINETGECNENKNNFFVTAAYFPNEVLFVYRQEALQAPEFCILFISIIYFVRASLCIKMFLL